MLNINVNIFVSEYESYSSIAGRGGAAVVGGLGRRLLFVGRRLGGAFTRGAAVVCCCCSFPVAPSVLFVLGRSGGR